MKHSNPPKQIKILKLEGQNLNKFGGNWCEIDCTNKVFNWKNDSEVIDYLLDYFYHKKSLRKIKDFKRIIVKEENSVVFLLQSFDPNKSKVYEYACKVSFENYQDFLE